MLSKKDQLEIELITTYYQTSKSNLANRLRLRDNAILVYLFATSFLFGSSFLKTIGFFVKPLLVIPFLAFAVMLVVNYHNEYIARIVQYLGYEIYQEIRNLDISITEWSFAKGHLELEKNQWFGADRALAERLIVCTPVLIVLLLTASEFAHQLFLLSDSTAAANSDFIILFSWPFGLLLLVLSYSTNLKVNKFKAGIYASLPGRDK